MDAAVYIDRMEKAVAKANVSLIKLREENATLKQRNTALEDRVNELENLVKFKNNPLESQSKSNDNCEIELAGSGDGCEDNNRTEIMDELDQDLADLLDESSSSDNDADQVSTLDGPELDTNTLVEEVVVSDSDSVDSEEAAVAVDNESQRPSSSDNIDYLLQQLSTSNIRQIADIIKKKAIPPVLCKAITGYIEKLAKDQSHMYTSNGSERVTDIFTPPAIVEKLILLVQMLTHVASENSEMMSFILLVHRLLVDRTVRSLRKHLNQSMLWTFLGYSSLGYQSVADKSVKTSKQNIEVTAGELKECSQEQNSLSIETNTFAAAEDAINEPVKQIIPERLLIRYELENCWRIISLMLLCFKLGLPSLCSPLCLEICQNYPLLSWMAIDDAGTDPNVGWVKTLSCHGAGVIIGLVYPLLHVNSVDSPFAGSLPSLFVLFDCFLLPAIDHILMKSKETSDLIRVDTGVLSYYKDKVVRLIELFSSSYVGCTSSVKKGCELLLLSNSTRVYEMSDNPTAIFLSRVQGCLRVSQDPSLLRGNSTNDSAQGITSTTTQSDVLPEMITTALCLSCREIGFFESLKAMLNFDQSESSMSSEVFRCFGFDCIEPICSFIGTAVAQTERMNNCRKNVSVKWNDTENCSVMRSFINCMSWINCNNNLTLENSQTATLMTNHFMEQFHTTWNNYIGAVPNHGNLAQLDLVAGFLTMIKGLFSTVYLQYSDNVHKVMTTNMTYAQGYVHGWKVGTSGSETLAVSVAYRLKGIKYCCDCLNIPVSFLSIGQQLHMVKQDILSQGLAPHTEQEFIAKEKQQASLDCLLSLFSITSLVDGELSVVECLSVLDSSVIHYNMLAANTVAGGADGPVTCGEQDWQRLHFTALNAIGLISSAFFEFLVFQTLCNVRALVRTLITMLQSPQMRSLCGQLMESGDGNASYFVESICIAAIRFVISVPFQWGGGSSNSAVMIDVVHLCQCMLTCPMLSRTRAGSPSTSSNVASPFALPDDVSQWLYMSHSQRIPVFIINLDKRYDRWIRCLNMCESNGLAAVRFSAVDGTQLPHNSYEYSSSSNSKDGIPFSVVSEFWDSTLNAEFDFGCTVNMLTPMTTSERGCAMSHVSIWKAIVDVSNKLSAASSIQSVQKQQKISKPTHESGTPWNVTAYECWSAAAASGVWNCKYIQEFPEDQLSSHEGGQPVVSFIPSAPVCWLQSQHSTTKRKASHSDSSSNASMNLRQDDWYLILEDDCSINQRDTASIFGLDFRMQLNDVVRRLPVDWGICYLGYVIPRNAKKNMIGKHFMKPNYVWQLHAYIISSRSAKYLLSSLPVNKPVDNFLATLIHSGGLKAFCVTQSMMKQGGTAEERQLNSNIRHSGRLYGNNGDRELSQKKKKK